jgi:tetratricopeptide (TPR) repeat protein
MSTKPRRDESCLPRADIEFFNRETAHSSVFRRTLFALPVSAWRQALHAHPEWVTISVLEALLEHAREEIDRNPATARRITGLVVHFAPAVPVPPGRTILRVALCGTAYKDHGNALRRTGRVDLALTAANLALRILAEDDTLIVERASALVLKAHVQHDRGRHAEAFGLLDESASIFARRGETRRHLQTIILHGIFLFERDNPAGALAQFRIARPIAEALGDQRELARILNNTGHCALKLNDLPAAWDYLVQAAAAFASERMEAEIPRAQWGLARLVSSREPAEAVADLRKIYTVFSSRGMVVEAATALLEIATILVQEDHNKPIVRTLCNQLGDLFAATTMPAPALRALAHLQSQALGTNDALIADVTHVRNYFRHLQQPTPPVFAPGH